MTTRSKKHFGPISPGTRPRRPRRTVRDVVPARWAWHHRTLVALRRRLLDEQVEQLRDALQSSGAEPGETLIEPREERDFTLALLVREHDALKEVNDALERIQRGNYGVCETTGLPIPAARLRAVPWTRHVREVALRQEAARKHDGRMPDEEGG